MKKHPLSFKSDILRQRILATGLVLMGLLAAPSFPAYAANKITLSNPRNTSVMTQDLPLFYRELVAFDTNTHGKLAFPEVPPSFRFAAQTNIVPILVHEAGLASRSYPLVFIPGQEGQAPILAVMVGVGDNVNRFVDADGKWRQGAYIPAWVRRYPFIAVRPQDAQEPMLAIDPQAEWVKSGGGEPFVGTDGKATPRLQRVLDFQREFQIFAERTEAIAKALMDAGVLEEGTLRIEPPQADKAGEAREIKGFLLVSETKLKALSDEALLKLFKADALGLAYIQLISMGSLPNLIEPEALAQAAPSGASKNKPKK